MRKYYFTERILNMWHSLPPDTVVRSLTVNRTDGTIQCDGVIGV